ncbi:MAG: class I SAM-dependent methyltransferase [Balneolaceae bacterium]|nr:class I SAM-dependent methyltransferase [Balneolaceae bacterium]
MIPSSISNYYKWHAPIYDFTRWSFLFGRSSLMHHFPLLADNASILDLGCGTGAITEVLCYSYPESEIIGLDASSHMLERAKSRNLQNVSWIHQPYQSNSFDNGQFDLITASYSLTMMNDIEQVLHAIKMHLKPDGKLVVVDFDSTPFPQFSKWMKRNRVNFDVQLFNKLEKGFAATSIQTQSAFGGLYSYSTFVGSK